MSYRDSDPYRTLDLKKDSSPEDIKKAYRRLALLNHPDKNPGNRVSAEEKFKSISKAYETLSDPVKRRAYDMSRSEPPAARSSDRKVPYSFFNDPFLMIPRRMAMDTSRHVSDLDDAFRIFEGFFGSEYNDMFRGVSPGDIFSNPSPAGPQSRSGEYSMWSSSSTSASISNGKQVTRTEKAVRHCDGRIESTVIVEEKDLRSGQVTRRTTSGGGPQGLSESSSLQRLSYHI